MKITLVIAGFALASLIGCSQQQTTTNKPQEPPKPPEKWQGWTKQEQSWWYSTTQGSRLLPESWAKALEKKGSTDKVFGDDNLKSLNYITEHNTSGWPIGFVVDTQSDQSRLSGAKLTYPTMAANGDLEKPWFGLNCSACHTNDMTYQGHTMRLDGAPTLGDFQTMLEEMLDGLKETSTDGAKFDRFATAVLGGSATDAQKTTLRRELGELIAWEANLAAKNDTPLRYGHGRLDAQGHILNKIEMLAVLAKPTAEVGKQVAIATPSDAPASYPFIWDAPIEDVVQYNGIVANSPEYTIRGNVTNIGALGRNIGEVIGVFGQVDTKTPTLIQGYNSTVQISNLIDLERRLITLDPPKWPDWLGKLDDAKLALGKTIYEGGTDSATGRNYHDMALGNCASCHENQKDVKNTEGKYTSITVSFQPLQEGQTDIWLACNTYRFQSDSGWLDGRRVLPLSSERFGATNVSVAKMLKHTVVEAIAGDAGDLAAKAWHDLVGQRYKSNLLRAPPPSRVVYLPGLKDTVANRAKQNQAKECLTQNAAADSFNLHYKARPLDGIWATAPYLHNGSVPTLYDLLLPATVMNESDKPPPAPVQCDRDGADKACTRPDDFSVGSREYDPRLAGFVSTPNLPGTSEFHVYQADGEPVLGNYNNGHYYGVALDDKERWALVEYLKSL
ncbi:MAG: hypothetical protein JOZ72_16825 [Alphaproteobacteria bacterium]|nr:hypothetical protein [Alphaproteobacteria bacterium]